MTVLASRIYEEILDLPLEERLGLIDRLVQSVTPVSRNIRQAWIAEAEHRYEAFKRGEIDAVSGEDVFKRIKDRLNP